jgi:nicotinate-nucleotide adenylyltransferase
MKIAFFGGTFDPVHRGHIQIASSAVERFDIGQVLFVPAFIQPLKQTQQATDYHHRFAMLALATQDRREFVVSDLEAPKDSKTPNYSLNTIRELKRTLRKADTLYFLLGIDAFLAIAKWHKPAELLRECEFIIASRPGFSMGEVAAALPEELRPRKDVLSIAHKQKLDFSRDPVQTIALPGITLHLMGDISVRVSATQIRAAAKSAGKARLRSLVGDAVAEYIQKTGIYRRATQNAPAVKSARAKTGAVELSKHSRGMGASKANR